LSKALRRPHVLATTLLVRSPFGKYTESNDFEECRGKSAAPQQKLRNLLTPRSVSCSVLLDSQAYCENGDRDYEVDI
jgi:hypothetical protein